VGQQSQNPKVKLDSRIAGGNDMPDHPMTLEFDEHIRIPLSSLGDDDRLRVMAAIDVLRNWNDDAALRAKATRIDDMEELYVFPASDFLVTFRIEPGKIVVNSIFRPEALRRFKSMPEPLRV